MLGCSGPRPAPVPEPDPAPRPGYASTAPITEPQIFARDTISTARPEFAITFSPDGRTAYFDVAAEDRSSFAIMQSTFDGERWGPPAPTAFSTGAHRDADPFVTADGRRLYFSSNRPVGDRTDWNTWYVDREGDRWSEPRLLAGAPSGPENEVFVSIAADGTMYFASNKTGNGDIYRAPRDPSGAYPTAAPLAIDPARGENNPAISPDGTLLVFAAERDGGLGGGDLYAVRLDRATPTQPTLLRAASSPFADFAPAFSPDGRYLFFTSERPGVAPARAEGRPPGDIYQIDLAAALAE